MIFAGKSLLSHYRFGRTHCRLFLRGRAVPMRSPFAGECERRLGHCHRCEIPAGTLFIGFNLGRCASNFNRGINDVGMHVCMNERVRWHNFQTCESTRSRRDEWDVLKCMQSNEQRHTNKSVAKVHSWCFQISTASVSRLLLIVLAFLLCMSAISKQFRFQFLILPSSSVDEFSCQIPMNHKKPLCHLSAARERRFHAKFTKISSMKRPLSCRCRSRHTNKWQQMLIKPSDRPAVEAEMLSLPAKVWKRLRSTCPIL